ESNSDGTISVRITISASQMAIVTNWQANNRDAPLGAVLYGQLVGFAGPDLSSNAVPPPLLVTLLPSQSAANLVAGMR
ncbi:MAG TPA: hypothetical protein VGS21_12315, partial [Acidimicrobiales bacterium]|nr:hypothetical protein [Acidimicrobiales bacterium]